MTPAHTASSIITYDKAAACYVETRAGHVPSAKENSATWDEPTCTFTLKSWRIHGVDRAEHTVTRRFTTPDRIDWKECAVRADGTVFFEGSGSYDRVRR